MASSDREQAELIRTLYRNIPLTVVCMIFGAAVFCAGLYYLAPDRWRYIAAWSGVSLGLAAAQLGLWVWHRRVRPADAVWRPWARFLTLASLADGARWGFGSIWLPEPGRADQQLWACMVVGGAACASVASLGSYTPAFYALLSAAMIPYFVWAVMIGDPRYLGVALLGVILSVAIAGLGYRQARSLAEALRLRFENHDLAERLGEQKELAEQANRAKSQFLAAASHDLRQPMHALGLFVAALARTRMTPQGRRLTGQVAETVEAMGDMFASLLDISQLDAGLVTPDRRTFAIGPLLKRLCREQQAEVAGRPVSLTWVDCSAVVETDPVLLERMLRNLISNAMRHTAKGRVLVGCRRQGDRLTVQIWDTGPGIAPAHREQIFKEYFQLGNPGRDRTRGFGLGLAITRRLSMLLECPVELHSEVGRGSMFSLSMPLAVRPAVGSPSAETPRARNPQGGVIYIIDDEILVQASMTELLGVWGYDVVAAGSAPELLARARSRQPPDLLICDWRLQGEETALDAIAQVRARYSQSLPILLITGDIAPERLRAARDTGLVLLHKPVPPGKLRAALVNLISRASVVDR